MPWLQGLTGLKCLSLARHWHRPFQGDDKQLFQLTQLHSLSYGNSNEDHSSIFMDLRGISMPHLMRLSLCGSLFTHWLDDGLGFSPLTSLVTLDISHSSFPGVRPLTTSHCRLQGCLWPMCMRSEAHDVQSSLESASRLSSPHKLCI